MATALPSYLGKDFDQCPPGHRFGLYFEGWTDGFALPTNGKTDAFRKVTQLPEHSRQALVALCARQQDLATRLGDSVLTYPVRLSAPLATGLGNEHPLENGFAFLNPYGLPYLAGSGVKGVLRRAAEELASGDWGETAGWDQSTIDLLFGPGEEDPERDTHPRRGALVFWDLYFQPPKGKGALSVEIMTPHHSGYLQNGGTPHANESPNPIPFLAVPASSTCTLYVQCNPALISEEHNARRGTWRARIEAAIDHAGEWLGFGAKTAVGYGRLEIEPAAAAEREARRQKERDAQAAEEEKKRVEGMPPAEQFIAKLDVELKKLPTHPRGGQPIVQATSGTHWQPVLEQLAEHINSINDLAAAEREALATAVKKRLMAHFKVEGKAEKAMKQQLSAIRGN